MPASPGDKYTVIFENVVAPVPPVTIGTISTGATKRAWLTELNIGSKNAAALAGAEFSIHRATIATGTGGTAYTPNPIDPGAAASLFTAKSANTLVWTVEPTFALPAQAIYRIGLNAVASEIWTPPEPIMIPLSTMLVIRIEADASATKVQWVVTATVQE